jgi:hypothetical protein
MQIKPQQNTISPIADSQRLKKRKITILLKKWENMSSYTLSVEEWIEGKKLSREQFNNENQPFINKYTL